MRLPYIYKRYRKSRASYPDGVLLVADNGGKTLDRYTVLYEPKVGYPDTKYDRYYYPYLGMSENPYELHGFHQHGASEFRLSVWNDKWLGKVIDFEELPTKCQQAVKEDLELYG
tara:strand:+ start:123 stop:464 length:342 start_codon:yes stop_codon:yes gene_type:complete